MAAPIARPVKPASVIGRIHDPLWAEFFDETLADLEGSLVVTDFLADQKDARVSTHLLPHGLI